MTEYKINSMKEEKSHEKIEHPCKHRLIMSLMVVSPSAFAAGEESQTGTSNEVLGTSATQDVGVSYRTHVQNNGWETPGLLTGIAPEPRARASAWRPLNA